MKQSQKLLESFKANLKEDEELKGKDILYVFENFNTGVDKNQEKLIKFVNDELNLGYQSDNQGKFTTSDENDIWNTIQHLPGKQVENLIRLCYGDDIANKFEAFLNDSLDNLNTSQIKYINEEEFYGGGANEKVGGDYDDFIYELSNFRATMNNWYDQCSTGLARQIVEETIMSFDNLLTRYEQQKDIEIHGAMNESQELNEDEGFKHFDNEESVKTEFTNPIIFTPDKIEQNGTGELSKCKFNSVNANETNPEENPDIYVGYVVLEDKNGNLIGFKHYWNGKGDIAIDHTDVKSNSLYNQGKLVYYIGEKVN